MKKCKLRHGMLLLLMLIMVGIGSTGVDASPHDRAKTHSSKEVSAESTYIEGEAIILYQNAGKSKALFKASALTKDEMALAKTYDFTGAAAKSAKQSGSNANFSISLVKSDSLTTKQMIQKLKKTPGVVYATANIKLKASAVSNDAYSGYQWDLENTGQNGGSAGLDLNADRLPAPTDTTEKVVAVIDTGVDYTHEDLANRMWNNPFADTAKLKGRHGFDFANVDDDPIDDYGHGTHVAGAITGEANNQVGISGVAASNNIKIMALKMLDADGYGDSIAAVGCYNYIYQAQNLGVNVIAVNNSWGAISEEDESPIFKKIIDLVGAKGAISICAAGNDSMDVDSFYNLPSGIDSKYIVSIAASNENDERPLFSNYGINSVDLAVPGTNILSSVIQDTFNPTLYAQKDDYCDTYYSFSEDTLVDSKTPIDNKIAYHMPKNYENANVSIDKDMFFGEKNADAASFSWKISDAREGETYQLYLPYSNNASNTEIFSSLMLRIKSPDLASDALWTSVFDVYNTTLNQNGEYLTTGNPFWMSLMGDTKHWEHFAFPVADKGTIARMNNALLFELNVQVAGDYEIHFDDLGFSKANLTQDKFGKYDFYNGTSMSTAIATGAFAALADAYPQKSSTELQAMLLGSIRPSDAFAGIIRTGGILDLSKASDPQHSLTSAAINNNGQIQLTGYFLDGASVYINNTLTVPAKSDANNIFITLDQAYQNRLLKFRVEKNGISRSINFYCSMGKSLTSLTTVPFPYDNGSLASDGTNLYYVTTDGIISMLTSSSGDDENEDYDEEWAEPDLLANEDAGAAYSFTEIGAALEENGIFDEVEKVSYDYMIYLDSQMVVSNHKLWAIANLNFNFSLQRQLIYFDLDNLTWNKAADLPSAFDSLSNITLGVYNNVPYLIGGLNEATNKASAQVMYLKQSQWHSAPNLPSARFASKALQTGSKLVVTLGGNDAGSCPVNMIFDGTNWTSSKVTWPTLNRVSEYNYLKNGTSYTLAYYTADISLVEKGILYFGSPADGLGEIFQYQTDNDVLSTLDYSVSKYYNDGDFHAAAVNDTYYVLNTGLSAASAVDEAEKQASVLTMPIKSGMTAITDSSSEGGYVSGTGTYLPGDIITLQAQVETGYYLKSFLVNGKIISGKSTTFYVGDAASYSAQAVTSAYIQKITLNSSALELVNKQKIQLKATISPSNAGNKKLVWQSSNAKVATVSQTGIITAVSSKIGATATITVKASDRGKVIASCKVKIVGKLLRKNATTSVGGLTYKAAISDRKNGKVILYRVKNKKAKKVTVPAAIKVNGVSYKVTAIDKKALKGLPKLTRITIRSANLAKFPKGSLSSLSKKTVIKVPAKSKTAMKKLIKKAGFKGTIR